MGKKKICKEYTFSILSCLWAAAMPYSILCGRLVLSDRFKWQV